MSNFKKVDSTFKAILGHIYISKEDFTLPFLNYILTVFKRMKECIKNEVSKFRTEIGVTQEDLAAKVNVSRQTIIALEKGNYTPSILLALKIAGFFKMPVEKIFKIAHEK